MNQRKRAKEMKELLALLSEKALDGVDLGKLESVICELSEVESLIRDTEAAIARADSMEENERMAHAGQMMLKEALQVWMQGAEARLKRIQEAIERQTN